MVGEKFCDLHLHLGASVTPHFLWELAHQQGINTKEKNYFKFIKNFKIKKTTSDKYLKRIDKKNSSPFDISQKIQSSPEAVEKCVHYVISKQYRDYNVCQIEIRFNPLFRNRNGEFDVDKIIFSALSGMHRAMIDYPVKAGLILETDRQFSYEKHKIIFEKAVKYKKLGIVGVDVSGPNPSSGFSIDMFIELFSFVKKQGLKTTFHTGEFTSVEEVWQVIEKIKPDRIGHGIASINDKELMKEIAKRKIVLEICPTSNIKTQVVSSWEKMGQIINIFIKNKVLFTINSDGPEFFGMSIKDEFKNLLKRKIIDERKIKEIISFSFKASFI
ncbi:MAG: adenosine deaminase [Patescibacteria group bacterium]|nr:adenosine deaminase [Patescibacteria group bacterium]